MGNKISKDEEEFKSTPKKITSQTSKLYSDEKPFAEYESAILNRHSNLWLPVKFRP